MPTYNYECSGCNHSMEVFQSITDKKLKKCPECGKNKLHRLIGTGGGIIFRGSGFYETDYKKSGASPTKSQPKKNDSACKSCANSEVCPASAE